MGMQLTTGTSDISCWTVVVPDKLGKTSGAGEGTCDSWITWRCWLQLPGNFSRYPLNQIFNQGRRKHVYGCRNSMFNARQSWFRRNNWWLCGWFTVMHTLRYNTPPSSRSQSPNRLQGTAWWSFWPIGTSRRHLKTVLKKKGCNQLTIKEAAWLLNNPIKISPNTLLT